jgi:polyisoprenoid-binding protein YceI
MTTTSPLQNVTQLTGSYTLDPAHSRIGFVTRHAMVTKVRGSFNEFHGTAMIDGEDPSRSSVTVTIQAASIDTRSAQRDEHLRAGDFLEVETHPEITFVSTAVRRTAETEAEITGDLTIKGVTRSVTVPFTFEGMATDPFGNLRLGFEGSTAINRSDFGLTWNAALETGGVLVSDRIVLEFEISAIKNS